MTRRTVLLGVSPALLAFQISKKAPRLLRKTDPEYSEEARKARLNGEVVLYAVIQPTGRADSFKVIHSLGLGLDEQAMAAVEQWEFQPGEKDDKPVSVAATIEVKFRLLPNHGYQPAWYSAQVGFQIPSDAHRPVLQHARFPPNGEPPDTGSVTIACSIDEQGAPADLRVDKSTAGSLEAEALSFVRQWQFSPARKDGKPVAAPATIEVAYGSPAGPPSRPNPPATPL